MNNREIEFGVWLIYQFVDGVKEVKARGKPISDSSGVKYVSVYGHAAYHKLDGQSEKVLYIGTKDRNSLEEWYNAG